MGKREVWSKLRNPSFFQMNFRTRKDCLCEKVDSNREVITKKVDPIPAMQICHGFRLQIRQSPVMISPLETDFQSANHFMSVVISGNSFEGKGTR